MVIEAGIQPRVVVPFTRDRDRVAARDPEPSRRTTSRTGWARRCGPRARSSGRTRARRSTSSPTARTPRPCQAQGDDVRVRWAGVGPRGQQRGHHQPRGPPELLRGPSTRRPSSRWPTSRPSRSTLSLTLTLDDEPSPRRRSPSSPQVRRALVVPFSRSGRRRGPGPARRVRRPRRRQHGLRRDPAAAGDLGAPREPGQPVPREGAQDRSRRCELEVRTPDAYQGGMEGFDVVVVDSVSPPTRSASGRFVLVNAVPGRCAARGAGPPRHSRHHGLGPRRTRSCARSTSPR